MAAHADLVGRGRGQLRRLPDIGRRGRFGVLLRRPVAGFAGAACKAAPLIRIHPRMRALLERVEDVLMAGRRRRRTRRKAKRGRSSCSWPESRAPARISHTGNQCPTRALILRMDRADRERAAGSVANRAAFAERVVLARKCDAVGMSTWHPEQADENGCTGLISPCGSVTWIQPGEATGRSAPNH